MIYAAGIAVFASIILPLVLLLLFVEAKVVKKGEVRLTLNNDTEKDLSIVSGSSLLSSLSENGIYLPSACGGSGSCGQCKCVVEKGGGDLLPTEFPHLSRKEIIDNTRLACQLKVKNDLNINVPDEIFNIKKYSAEVISNNNVATFIKELVVRPDPGQTFTFKAGSYMQIDIPEYDICFTDFDIAERFVESWNRFSVFKLCSTLDDPIFRAYSLANPPYENDRLKFTVRIATPPPGTEDTPPGQGSSYIFNLKRGDEITLSGPYGDFFVNETDHEICFIGGGAGMAPMRSHILHQLNTLNTKRETTFWYGARSVQEIFYMDEFKQLEEKYDNFSCHVALSDPEPNEKWTGMRGFIHQCLYDHYLKSHDDPSEIEYYLCGPPQMIEAVTQMLDGLGVEKDMIYYDIF